jgi:hypothetical protein
MSSLIEHKVFANLPAEVLEKPTPDALKQFLKKEIKTQTNLVILWVSLASLGFGYSIYENGGIDSAGLMILFGCLAVALMSHFKKRQFAISDSEILEVLRQHNQTA